MKKKLRISILFNEPVSGGIDELQYSGHYATAMSGGDAAPRNRNGQAGISDADRLRSIDLSEVGVLDEMKDIREALRTLGYKPTIVNVNSDIHRLIDHLRSDRPDLIFNLVESLENDSSQEMNVAGLYELLKIPYTGAGPFALGLALNKPRVKELLSHHGIKTARFRTIHSGERVVAPQGAAFPLMVKPAEEDGSVGVSDSSVVYTAADLRRRVRYVHEVFNQPALVEEYIDGRELNVAILGDRNAVVLPISEIDFSGLPDDMHRIVSYDAKWMNGSTAFEGTKGLCPARLTAAQRANLERTAMRAFRLVGCRDYCRVDFRMTPAGEIYVLEVNPNPDISDDAGFARSAKAYGLTFPQIIARIVESALDRHGVLESHA